MDTCGHVAWQIKNPEQDTKTTKQKATRRSPSQICVSPSSREAKQKAKGARPNKNNHEQRFAMDTVVKSHRVATQNYATNELVATQ